MREGQCRGAALRSPFERFEDLVRERGVEVFADPDATLEGSKLAWLWGDGDRHELRDRASVASSEPPLRLIDPQDHETEYHAAGKIHR